MTGRDFPKLPEQIAAEERYAEGKRHLDGAKDLDASSVRLALGVCIMGLADERTRAQGITLDVAWVAKALDMLLAGRVPQERQRLEDEVPRARPAVIQVNAIEDSDGEPG